MKYNVNLCILLNNQIFFKNCCSFPVYPLELFLGFDKFNFHWKSLGFTHFTLLCALGPLPCNHYMSYFLPQRMERLTRTTNWLYIVHFTTSLFLLGLFLFLWIFLSFAQLATWHENIFSGYSYQNLSYRINFSGWQRAMWSIDYVLWKWCEMTQIFLFQEYPFWN